MSEHNFNSSYGECSIHGQYNNKFHYCRKCIEDPNIIIYRCQKCNSPKPIHIETYNHLREENPEQLKCNYCNWDDNRAVEIIYARKKEEKKELEKSNKIKVKGSKSKKPKGCLIAVGVIILVVIVGVYDDYKTKKLKEQTQTRTIGSRVIFTGYILRPGQKLFIKRRDLSKSAPKRVLVKFPKTNRQDVINWDTTKPRIWIKSSNNGPTLKIFIELPFGLELSDLDFSFGK